MKYTALLKNIISISYYFTTSVAIITIISFIYSFWEPGPIMDILNRSENLQLSSKVFLTVLLIYGLISCSLWIYLLSLIRSFMTNILFTWFRVKNLKLIGQLLIGITTFDNVSSLIFDVVFNEEIKNDFNFPSFLLIIAIGLFFIFLSEIFNKAKIYKEENELTV